MDSFESFKYTCLWCVGEHGDCPPVDIKETICPGVDKLPGLLQSLHQIYGRDMGPGHQVTCTIPPHAAHKH